jgi:penicillin-binding protein 1B
MTKSTSPPPADPAANDQVRHPRKRRPSLLRAAAAWLGFMLLGGVLVGGFALGSYLVYLDGVIRTQFEGKRWALPARVYARPLELFPGMALSADPFARELELLRYRALPQPEGPGTYSRSGETFDVILRSFTFWDGTEPSRQVRLVFKGNTLAAITSLDGQENPSLVRVEPLEIAGIYPAHPEDRILLKREQLPPVLVDTLLAVEDRTFYEHFGIDPKGIFRALLANLKAGRTVQGGSTLTQQLVKNFFLSNERTLQRKINEALMAVLVDWHYSKDEILETYSNEVYLGQDGNRAIHGLGLASRFYFDRDLAELDLHHLALLIGLINGPSKYDPRRHPELAKERRALVLDVMVEQQLISPQDATIARQMPLDVSPDPPSGITRYPAFLELVQRQLQQYYRKEDLTTEGLNIFTTLDPEVQEVAEQAIQERLPVLEKSRRKIAPLQAAAVVVSTQTADVLAVVGGRDVRLAGFNRALDAQRPVGSLLKPAIYLTALEHPDEYTLATLLDDTRPVVYTDGTGRQWSPHNYDRRFHGRVMLREALAHSYNIPTARLGLDLDVIQVIDTLKRLGIQHDMKPYPSLLLGAVDLAPLEVAQMYESIASGGFRMPLRAISEVTAADGKPLQHYSLDVEKVVEPGPAYLITNAMQQVVQQGTASAMKQKISPTLGIAGKTGTTDEYRDSWFTGFSGNKLAVVWVGRDDNEPIGMTGAQGALPVWMSLMGNLNLEPLDTPPPPEIETAMIDPGSGLRAGKHCGRAMSLPFLSGSVPHSASSCGNTRVAARKNRSNPDNGSGQDALQTEPFPAATESGSNHSPSPAGQPPMRDFFKRLAE